MREGEKYLLLINMCMFLVSTLLVPSGFPNNGAEETEWGCVSMLWRRNCRLERQWVAKNPTMMKQGRAWKSPERNSHLRSSSFKMVQDKDENRWGPQFRIYEACHPLCPSTGKLGALSTCLLFHEGGDALLPGENSMVALTDVFSCGLQTIRHSSRAVIYLSYLQHGPQ